MPKVRTRTSNRTTPAPTPEPASPPPRWRETFIGWHFTEQLWREIYVRTASALLAAFVVYLVAVIAGEVSAEPLLYILTAGVIGSAFLMLSVEGRGHRWVEWALLVVVFGLGITIVLGFQQGWLR